MKHSIFYYALVLFISSFCLSACSDDDDKDDNGGGSGDINTEGMAITGKAEQKGASWAELSGSIENPNNYKVTGYGIEYNEQGNEKVTKKAASDLSDNKFKVKIEGLNPKTTYRFRAYVNVRGGDTSFGEYKTFATDDFSNIVSAPTYSVASTSATLKATVEKAKYEAEKCAVGFALSEKNGAIKDGGNEFNTYVIKPSFGSDTKAELSKIVTGLTVGQTYYYASFTQIGNAYRFSAVKNFKINAADQTRYAKDGITYEVKSESDKTAKVIKISDPVEKEELYVLDEVPLKGSNFKVVEIASKAAYNNKTLKKIHLNASIKEIGSEAFCNCTNMTKVELSNNLETIGESAFDNSLITSLKIPSKVTKIGPNAFRKCSLMQSVTFEAKLTEIPEGMFDQCTQLKNVEIPATVKKIGAYAFRNILGWYEEKDNRYASWGTHKYHLMIPDAVEEIGVSAFQNCNSRSYQRLIVSLGNNTSCKLKTIGSSAFLDMPISNIFCWATDPPASIMINEDLYATCKLYVKESSMSAYKASWGRGWGRFDNIDKIYPE